MTNEQAPMTNQERPATPKKVRVWPGMPTRGTQMVESFVGFFPIWIALIGITLALLMPLIQSCRNAAENRAGQAPRLNVENR
jgi:hypothetical protein